MTVDTDHDEDGRGPPASGGRQPGPTAAVDPRRLRLTALAIALLLVAALGTIVVSRYVASELAVAETRTLLARLADAPAPEGTEPVAVAAPADPVAFLELLVTDIQDTWAELFAASGAEYPRTSLVVFRDAVRSACGGATAEMGPFYCSADGRVYLDTAFFEDLASRLRAPGDFAAAYVVAHEFGHHVQNVLGISRAVARAQAARPELANALSVRLELQADCLAGVWAHSAYQQGQLEPGDLEAAIAAAEAVGDDRLQRAATGTIQPETFTHGTSQQRAAWFLQGFRDGDPEHCDTFARDMP